MVRASALNRSACLREAAPAYAKPPLRRAQVGRRRQGAQAQVTLRHEN